MTNIRNALMQAAGSASGDKVYVEDVFSTHLYTGTGSTLAIDNGIDLSGEGGLVWIKRRSTTRSHGLFDTERGVNQRLYSNYDLASGTNTSSLTAFNSNGFTVGTESDINASSETNVSWTFRKQEGFFDIVTYTGDSNTNQTVSHNLGSAPGMIIVKRTDSTSNWTVYHRSIGSNYIYLNSSNAQVSSSDWQNITSSSFRAFDAINVSSASYVAYLFAHDDQSFGDDGDEAIIKCDSFSYSGSEVDINLGFEPQFFLYKASNVSNDWQILDVMRAWNENQYCRLNAHESAAEACYSNSTNYVKPYANGVKFKTGGSGRDYIYMAIRRGPMKEPSAGTDVLHIAENTTNLQNGTELPATGFPVDIQFGSWRDSNYSNYLITRLLGGKNLYTHANDAAAGPLFDFGHKQDVIEVTGNFDGTSSPRAYYSFRRYPKVFDVVVYGGDGTSSRVVTHNLGGTPSLAIFKSLTSTHEWSVVNDPSSGPIYLASNAARDTGTLINGWSATTVTLGPAYVQTNNSSNNYLLLLFGSLDGISKAGTYSGTGNDVNVTGLGAAARFVLIKRTDNTGDWYVYDTTSGIVSGNDPYILWNSTAAEVTNTDYIDPHSSGFTITSSAPDALNASGGTYLYLAFA